MPFDVAKESADIILLQKDLMILERGIVEGARRMQHDQVHQDDGFFQFWEHFFRFDCCRTAAILTDEEYSSAAAQSDL